MRLLPSWREPHKPEMASSTLNADNSQAVKLSLVLAFVALNLTIGGLVSWLKLPLYLDSLGIVMATILLGWRYGALCAVLTCLIGFFSRPFLPFYTGTSVAIALAVEFLRRRNMYRNLAYAIISGVILAIVAALFSAPVTAIVFGGVTASGSDLVTAFFRSTGRSLLESVMISGLTAEPVDKTLVTLVAFFSLRGLPERFISQFKLRGISDK
jgi:energy-coupling factor transport system substrate-specific component